MQDTAARLKGIVNPGNIYIITNKVYFFEIKRHIHGFKIPDENIILEPQGKNTAPAIGLCSRIISQRNKSAANKGTSGKEPMAIPEGLIIESKKRPVRYGTKPLLKAEITPRTESKIIFF